MKNRGRNQQMRRASINRNASTPAPESDTTSEEYKNLNKSTTVDNSKLTPPCKYIDGEIVDATYDEVKKEWIWIQ